MPLVTHGGFVPLTITPNNIYQMTIYNRLPTYLFIGYALVFRYFEGVFSFPNILTTVLIQIISLFCFYKMFQNGYFKQRVWLGVLGVIWVLFTYWLIAAYVLG